MKYILILACIVFTGCGSLTEQITPENDEREVPRTIHISVPFSPQAPFANWDDPYQEACEEMSLIMVHHFLAGTPLSREDADRELLALIAWEEEHGYPQDVTITQLADIAEDYYGYRTNNVFTEVRVETMKEELAAGNPIIVPAAGRDLGNPYFSGEGPWYHMLVITGYDARRFITNDPGTRRGEGFSYKYATLLNAIHDWTGVKEDIRTGVQKMLIIENDSAPLQPSSAG
ncbi:MAG: C39 family peptidase [Candidatus Peribacteraceae bacterium]|jgi:hypothetical protein